MCNWLVSQCSRVHSPNSAKRIASISCACKTGKEGPSACLGIFRASFCQKVSCKLFRGTGRKSAIELPTRPFKKKKIENLKIKRKASRSRSTGFARDFGSIVAGTKLFFYLFDYFVVNIINTARTHQLIFYTACIVFGLMIYFIRVIFLCFHFHLFCQLLCTLLWSLR